MPGGRGHERQALGDGRGHPGSRGGLHGLQDGQSVTRIKIKCDVKNKTPRGSSSHIEKQKLFKYL